MLQVGLLFLLACAVSVDGLGVGLLYGVRKVRIPLLSILIIAACSGLVMFGSMHLGAVFVGLFHPFVAKAIGSLILVSIGCWTLIQTIRTRNDGEDVDAPITKQIEVIRKPMKADMDHSGTISPAEASLLGLALSLDSLGAGIGAALLGFTPWLAAILITLCAGTFILVGLQIALIFSEVKWVGKLSFLPGLFLIFMGITKLF